MDIDLSGCSTSTEPNITGEPITNEDCESLGVTFDDVTFTSSPDLCLKILRTWTVVNWCQYEPNNPNSGGYETYTQVIKVIDDDSTEPIIVAGVITSETGSVMSNVQVVGNTDTVVCMDGVFEFPPMNTSELITITPLRDGDDNNGITTFDMVFIQRHILGILPLGSPYKMIAADINRSGSITTFDLVFLKRLILQQTTEFTTNTSWRFVDAKFEFTDPSNPFLDDFPEFIILNPVVGEEYDLDFVAVKIGDVNGSASND